MRAHLEELERQLAEHEKSAKHCHKSGAKRRHNGYLGQHASRGPYILIILLILAFLTLLVAHFQIVNELKKSHAKTETILSYTNAKLDECQQAYQIVLEDAQAFGKIYDIQYKGENETNETVAITNKAKELPEKNVWKEYNENGIIKDACIKETKVVQTPGDEVEIVILAAALGTEDPRLSLLIDGTFIQQFTIHGSDGIYKTSVLLPKGTHYLDLTFDNPETAKAVTVSLVRIGDRTLETDISVLDYGARFKMFDCEETKQGETLDKAGAMRFRIEKV